MARTDKDRPYWVKCNDHTMSRRVRHMHDRRYRRRECDFTEKYTDYRDYRSRNCGWELSGEDYWHWYSGGVPKWFVDHRWNNPERVRARDTLREAAKEYNANGELDDFDYENRQHRHNASYYYW